MTIVCHEKRFLFIKTGKTGGSSVEIALSRLCGAGDIVTPLGLENGPDEELRREAGGHPPVNWKKPWWHYRLGKELRHRIKYGKKPLVLDEHARASQLYAYLGETIWSTYFKFTIERNPWDKAVSRYWWQKHMHHQRARSEFPSINEFLQWIAHKRPQWLTNWGHYTIGDRIAVDRVLFYENIAKEILELERELDVPPGTLALPAKRAKSGLRGDPRHYSEILSDADRDLIAHVCRKEIEAFGYTFEHRKGTM